MNQNIDDVGFIDALLDSLGSDFNLDSGRIYSTGLSNGGFMSYRLACELSDRIAAIGPVAASVNLSSCNPQREVPVIQIHSYNDTNVPYNGGVGSGPSNHYNPPLDSVLNAWGTMNGCSVMADTVYNGNDYDHVHWTDCACRKNSRLFITHDGGHTWPGGNGWPGSDPVSTVIDANERIWSFFQANPFPCDASSIGKAEKGTFELDLYPNPAGEWLWIESSQRIASFHLLDSRGRLLRRIEGLNVKRGSIRVNEFEEGVYFLRIEHEDGNYSVRKFLIQD